MRWRETPEPEDDDEERIAILFAPMMIERIRALLGLTCMLPNDRDVLMDLARTAPQQLSRDQRHQVRVLMWKYRRDVPPALRPRLNPCDPIARELEIERV